MAETDRNCVKCGRALTACMGIVKAGDVLELIRGNGTTLRELCELCELQYKWDQDGNLVPRTDINDFLATLPQ